MFHRRELINCLQTYIILEVTGMSDSNITKRALAEALKELMEEKVFEKITIGDICERCEMNRKSFYYHFRDKYDLVNWIFDSELIAAVQQEDYEDTWLLFMDVCRFFYDNRSFYRKALCIKGQNSFFDHFRELLLSIIANSLQDMLGGEEISEFQTDFFADAFVMAFKRWIIEYNTMSPEEFIEQLKLCIKYVKIRYEDMEE